MTTSVQARHHLNIRKRIYKKLEKYPHPDKFKNFFDKLVYVAGIATPILTLPQFLRIWIDKDASGVSLITWSSYMAISLVFSIYGLLHKEKPIIIMYVSQFVLQVFIVLGIVLYG